MSRFVTIASLLLCLLNHGTDIATAWDDQDFFSSCPPVRCGKDGPEIRFPLRLESTNSSPSCGATPYMNLTCSGQDTILQHPFLGPSKVIALDYNNSFMRIIPLVEQQFSECPIQKIISLPAQAHALDYSKFSECPIQKKISLPAQAHALDYSSFLYCRFPGRLVDCSREFTPSGSAPYRDGAEGVCGSGAYFVVPDAAADSIAGPFPCLSKPGRVTYLVNNFLQMSLLPLDCKVLSNKVVPIPFSLQQPFNWTPNTFKQTAEAMITSSEITISWADWNIYTTSITDFCTDCENQGQPCAFSSQRNQPFCVPRLQSNKGSHHKVIAATSSVACFIVLSLMVATALYLSLKSKYNEEIHLKVEMFLRTTGTSKPTRYTFSEVKKIARRFKEKLGQGGYGSVYKGQLPNGIPVAVKMLENSTGEGEEFINEVATMGRIHHTNIVRLLGFCSEGTRRALIYEFMPNESLEKYIFSSDFNSSQRLLAPNKMLAIALGIARGMEYLHQGCNQRILHFDIKPHNILLDYSFNPKISDFGLAKQCARDQSIVTLTKARGTMGYIAPEIYSPNFGGISYKSDVYSFGMLVLEMVSGKRNSDPSIDNHDEVYFTEWIHDRVSIGQDLVPNREITEEEKEIVRQLAIVALWCIQWNPKNRPSMTKVVNMLTGRLQNLQMPPKPFVSSLSHPMS